MSGSGLFSARLQCLVRESRGEIASVVEAAAAEALQPSAIATLVSLRLADAAEHRTVTMCLIDAFVARAVEGDKLSVEIVACLFSGRPQDLFFASFKDATQQQKTRAIGFLRRWGAKGVFTKEAAVEAINAVNGVPPPRDVPLAVAVTTREGPEKALSVKAQAVQSIVAAIRDWMTHIETIPAPEREGLLRSTAALISPALTAASSDVLLVRAALHLREALQGSAADHPRTADDAGPVALTSVLGAARTGGRLLPEAVENVSSTAAVSYLHALETDVESSTPIDRPYPRKQRNLDAVYRGGLSSHSALHGVARFRTWFLRDEEWMVEKDMNRLSLTDCRSIGYRTAANATVVEPAVAGKRDRET